RRIYKVYQTTGDPSSETGWELIALTGKVRLVVDGLDRFKTYSFRVVAEGVAGESIPSEAASATAA
ncbi:MAG TPA: fibronectin type III domain-containing protein, partial [Flavobacteriales bacterium]|nr:fibronectin type III domain-containing protein [Flavobacteriales bacterium]